MRLPEPALPPMFTPNNLLSPVASVVMSFKPPPGKSHDNESNCECAGDLLCYDLARRSRHVSAGVIAELIHPAVAARVRRH